MEALTVALIINAIGWVWGAATLNTNVKALTVSVNNLTGKFEELDKRVDAHDTEIALIKSLTPTT